MLPLLGQIAAETIILSQNTGLPHCHHYLSPLSPSNDTLPASLLHSGANFEPGMINLSLSSGIDLHHSDGCPHMYIHMHKSNFTHTTSVLLLSWYLPNTF